MNKSIVYLLLVFAFFPQFAFSDNFYHKTIMQSVLINSSAPFWYLINVASNRAQPAKEISVNQNIFWGAITSFSNFQTTQQLKSWISQKTDCLFVFNNSILNKIGYYEYNDSDLNIYADQIDVALIIQKIESTNNFEISITNQLKQRMLAHLLLRKKIIIHRDSLVGNILWVDYALSQINGMPEVQAGFPKDKSLKKSPFCKKKKKNKEK